MNHETKNEDEAGFAVNQQTSVECYRVFILYKAISKIDANIQQETSQLAAVENDLRCEPLKARKEEKRICVQKQILAGWRMYISP